MGFKMKMKTYGQGKNPIRFIGLGIGGPIAGIAALVRRRKDKKAAQKLEGETQAQLAINAAPKNPQNPPVDQDLNADLNEDPNAYNRDAMQS